MRLYDPLQYSRYNIRNAVCVCVRSIYVRAIYTKSLMLINPLTKQVVWDVIYFKDESSKTIFTKNKFSGFNHLTKNKITPHTTIENMFINFVRKYSSFNLTTFLFVFNELWCCLLWRERARERERWLTKMFYYICRWFIILITLKHWNVLNTKGFYFFYFIKIYVYDFET